jgi:phage gpG-like protein
MRRLSSYLASTAQRRISGRLSPPNSALTQAVKGGSTPLMDSGSYIASIAAKSTARSAEAGSNKKQARLLQEGGTIKPKKAKFLTSPAGARTRSLMRQYGMTPRTCIAAMKADGYSIWTSFGKGGANMFARKGKRGQLFLLFILKRSVTIPARPHLYIDAQDEIVIMSMIENFIGYRR